MSNPAELMAMLTPHGVRLDEARGGVPTLIPLDIAGAMGMGHLDRAEALLLFAKYCLDSTVQSELWAYWFRAVMEKRGRDGWKTKPGQIEQLSRITLDEVIHERRCRRCGGTCEETKDDKKIECLACGGTGRRFLSEQKLGQRLGVTRHQIRAQWAGRIAWCRSELIVWELNGLAGVSKALRGH